MIVHRYDFSQERVGPVNSLEPEQLQTGHINANFRRGIGENFFAIAWSDKSLTGFLLADERNWLCDLGN